MRAVAFGLLIALAGCGPSLPAVSVATTPAASPDSAVIATAHPDAPPAVEQPPAAAPRLEPIPVAVSGGPFPIVTSLALRSRAIDQATVASAETALTRYLASLDRYRDNGFNPAELQLTGPFRDAVSGGLKASATPGVQRKFSLESVRVDRHFEKPWGTRALAEVTATIVDRAVGGSAPDQRETGRLRLTGERNLQVTDGWDMANGRWFNGSASPSAQEVGRSVVEPISWFLGMESWITGSEPSTWRQGEPTPFSTANSARIAGIDRARVTSRLFEGVRAAIERYDTFNGVPTGIATVRVSGTTVSRNADGRTERAAFERRFKVLLFGGWAPEVVDEETAPGVWLSGGDLALRNVDVNRA